MAAKPRDYDSTVARIAGNLLSGCNWFALGHDGLPDAEAMRMTAGNAVWMARAIVDETRRTEPCPEEG